jgi:mono/diheme cytochrome c family protein
MRRVAVAAATMIALASGPLPLSVIARASDPQDFALVERGRYLATVGDCTACHTSPGGKPFAGGRPIETPFGDLLGSNITPDRKTGIGGWDDDTFYNAMHEGFSDQPLYPAMPYPYYTKVTRADVTAIRAYLNTVAPVANDVQSNQLPFPFSIRASMRVWNALFFRKGEWQPDPGKSAEWNRGAYLVEGLGHCGACHTPKNILGGDKTDLRLRGYVLQGWLAPDITGDQRTGIGGWSVDEIVEYLKTGANRFQTASGPMAEEIDDSTQHWTEGDLRATAVYLKAQPAVSRQPGGPVQATDPAMQAGAAVYADQCAACHAMSGNGVARLFPALKNSGSVQSDDPTSLLRVVLDGTRAVATNRAPTGAAMPAFGWKLSDGQIAAVLTYIRNSWGNAAAAVSASQVTSARKALADRNE